MQPAEHEGSSIHLAHNDGYEYLELEPANAEQRIQSLFIYLPQSIYSRVPALQRKQLIAPQFKLQYWSLVSLVENALNGDGSSDDPDWALNILKAVSESDETNSYPAHPLKEEPGTLLIPILVQTEYISKGRVYWDQSLYYIHAIWGWSQIGEPGVELRFRGLLFIEKASSMDEGFDNLGNLWITFSHEMVELIE